jgi:UDP-3-O-[3-hydroxymyristoyl] glucosamine N-acyltransferase
VSFRLEELAQRVGAQVAGDGACRIDRVATLADAGEGAIAFLANSKYQKFLATTQASAVILAPEFQTACPTNALLSDNPYLTYAKVADLLMPEPAAQAGCHPSATVAPSAQVATDAWIGPGAVVEAGAVIGPRVYVGPGCVIGQGVRIGEDSHLVANVTLCHDVQIGCRAMIHPGAVIGSDGFGFANDQGAWVKVPQLGSVLIGHDVDIGANTTIDRGALTDTIIEDGVKLDNQIQIAHNVHIGAHTAMAACVGIAGSTRIGRNCTLGGGVGVAGHLEIGDNVHFSGQTLVTRSFNEPGLYSGNLPAVPSGIWRKTVARIRQLEDIMRRLKRLEKQVGPTGSAKDQ